MPDGLAARKGKTTGVEVAVFMRRLDEFKDF